MPTHTKKLVYHSHIASHLHYGLLLWGNNASENQLNKLQKIQNKCLRYLLPKETHLNACKKLNILTIRDMLKLANLKFAYKLANNHLPLRIITICHEDSRKTHCCLNTATILETEILQTSPEKLINYIGIAFSFRDHTVSCH